MTMIEPLVQYATDHTSEEPELLRELNRYTYLRMLHPQMLSGHHQGRLLAMVSRMVSPKYVLEIGTYTGYSALCLSEGLQHEGILHTIEKNPEFESGIREWIGRAGMEEKIHLHMGDAMEKIAELAPAIPFDLVFLDAGKEEYPQYYSLLRRHLKPGAFILADNVLWDGKVLTTPHSTDRDTAGIQAFNTMVANDPGTEQVILPMRDGLSIIRIMRPPLP
jgi:caffeoyl-CoA O-methyltransferase